MKDNEDFIKLLRSVSYDDVVSIAEMLYFPEDDISVLKNFRELLFEHLIDKDEYKRNSNKVGVSESLSGLSKMVKMLFSGVVNEVYHSYIRYLNRVGKQHCMFYYDKLTPAPVNLLYTRSIVESINKKVEYGVASEILKNTGAKDVPSASFNISMAYAESNKILSALHSQAT
ncbi:hypothetical protein D3C71_977490 [compost metagenome]